MIIEHRKIQKNGNQYHNPSMSHMLDNIPTYLNLIPRRIQINTNTASEQISEVWNSIIDEGNNKMILYLQILKNKFMEKAYLLFKRKN